MVKPLVRRSRKKWKKAVPYYIMFLPALVYLIVNNYLPMFGLAFAFQKVNFRKGILGGAWLGFENFRYLFATSDAWIMTRNTIGYNALFLVLNPVISISLAIFLYRIRGKFASKVYQTAIMLPYLMSMVVVSYVAYAFLNDAYGIMNRVILFFDGQPVSWYTSKQYWPFILTVVYVWHSVGLNMIIYLSAIIGISPDYYESAQLDGANQWQQIRCITLPLLKPTVITLTLLGIGHIFRSDFGLFYQVPLDTGMLYSVTQTIDTYVFRGLMQLGNLGMSAAAGFYQSFVCLIFVVSANALVRRFNNENSLF